MARILNGSRSCTCTPCVCLSEEIAFNQP